LGGCSVTSVGAKDRPHREEAALHMLLDGQQPNSLVVMTISERGGYGCNDHATALLADPGSGEKIHSAETGKIEFQRKVAR
jgi:hypothetical protein